LDVLAVPLFGSGDRADTPSREGVTHLLLSNLDPPELLRKFSPNQAELPVHVHSWDVNLELVRKLGVYRLSSSTLPPAYVPSLAERILESVRRGEPARALELLEARRSAGEPEIPDLLIFEATFLRERGDAQRADELLERAVALNPDHALAQLRLGGRMLECGDRKSARSHLRSALRSDPTNAAVVERLRALEK
jgi:tetratricopeptide (TPR) repeat protein